MVKRNDSDEKSIIPIVGIGASAGGLEAFEKFFSNMPSDSGMAFVLITHLDPNHKSILRELITKYTTMVVEEVKDKMEIKKDHIYIIPPNFNLAIKHNHLLLSNPDAPRGLRLPIDFFFRSLAEEKKESAICIILSGTGTDGSMGLREIKGVGGMVMVQEPNSAKYDGMPKSAITSALVDYILAPEEMPKQLIAYSNQSFNLKGKKISEPSIQITDYLQEVFSLLRSQTGHDFSAYKENTLIRRIERRMTVSNIYSIENYVDYLKENFNEMELLFRELLIGVTNFFRNKEAFDILKEKVIPTIFKNAGPNQVVRIWVPACSTGEEVYSIAILVHDYLDNIKKNYKVQIFGTDIDDIAINTARQGIYPDGIAVDVSPDLLKKYFDTENNTFQIKKKIRNTIVYAVQNIITDPPFSKMDLICCRNFLIYLTTDIQTKLLHLFYYSLNKEGFLFLGSSESISSVSSFYSVVERKWKIFQKIEPLISQIEIERPFPPLVDYSFKSKAKLTKNISKKLSYEDLIKDFLLNRYTPSAVIINKDNDILYFHGRTGKYLEPSKGMANLNIIDMAKEEYHLELASAIRRVNSQKKEFIVKNIKIKSNGENVIFNLIIIPFLDPKSIGELSIVIFEEVPLEKVEKQEKEIFESFNGVIAERVKELEEELSSTKHDLQTTIEELETTNEELNSTNEELQSSNEELQSTNEELQTSKEELQSINEELLTVNSELETKITDLSLINNDLANLMASTEIATIFLDMNFNIKKYTPSCIKFFNLIETDIGRPLSHISTNLKYSSLLEEAKNVKINLIPIQLDVEDDKGSWFSMRILPYRTLDNVIDGIVITFVDITLRRQAELELKEARDFAENIISTTQVPLLVLDSDLKVISANNEFYNLFLVNQSETIGKRIYDLGNHQLNAPKLREMLEDILPNKKVIMDFEVQNNFPNIGKRIFLFNAKELSGQNNKLPRILISVRNITKQKEEEEVITNARNLANLYKDLFAHDMNNILQAINSLIEYYSHFKDYPEKLEKLGKIEDVIKTQIKRGIKLITDVQKLSEVSQTKIKLGNINASKVLNEAVQNIINIFAERNVNINIEGLSNNLYVKGNEFLIDVFENILYNAVSYNDNEEEVKIQVEVSRSAEDGAQFLRFDFCDYGIGISEERKETLFRESFIKSNDKRGMGLGLSLVNKIIKGYEGKVWVENRIKDDYMKGSKFVILLKEAV